MLASPLPGEHPESTTLPESAQYAELATTAIDTACPAVALVRVAGVFKALTQPVYDLTVDGQPEFFANGVLVHNCFDATRYALRALRAFTAKPPPAAATEQDQELLRIMARNRRNEQQQRAESW